ncbi:transcriptional regulator [Acidithiobacillus thiooxidans]|uniref:Transcriptional regulator n=1 Tax=Acidithiobacillus thiooxidans TaxID=930 RepID=A0A1C2JEE5_ACITH|nr:helix-turn-helix transcriptional regulator [Acidithiobacillus thiooxidans]OCX68751.1 transcriptional regulator [Acidithiobacillus thiooxidans]OCX74601.1 transcriptional regulator [Acidithiobacillus thiooxidans]OCX75105.1 transcriptional regulator [Acidithiobacillus thiooxidans]OCX83412.1 transcriptional regulator [Acidithiobacillus thiooxidans]OCX86617.1 transcriptional regulator [Acidithiobacillus thiooxidans]
MSGDSLALGAFIRRHREKTTPQQAGLNALGRRRTPGLRREELAMLSGVSGTWITWIEQGRPIQPSVPTLDRLSKVLQLSHAERQHLFHLAGKADPQLESPPSAVAPTLLHLLKILQYPAYILDRYWNVPAWNAAAAAHFAGWLPASPAPEEKPPNLLKFLFLDPGARNFVDDWHSRCRRLVAEFRADVGKHLDDPEMARIITQLQSQSRTFAGLWPAQDVVEREGGRRVFQHPVHGRVVYEQSTLLPAAHTDMKLVILLPYQEDDLV